MALVTIPLWYSRHTGFRQGRALDGAAAGFAAQETQSTKGRAGRAWLARQRRCARRMGIERRGQCRSRFAALKGGVSGRPSARKQRERIDRRRQQVRLGLCRSWLVRSPLKSWMPNFCRNLKFQSGEPRDATSWRWFGWLR